MEFIINKNATLPIMLLDVINNGRYFNSKIYEMIQNSDIRFSMYRAVDNVKVISNKPALVTSKENEEGNDQYYIGYQFSEKETKNEGKYIGEFIITFFDKGKLIVPIKENLFIYIK